MRLAIGVLCISFGIVAVAVANPQRSQMAAQRFSYWRCLASEIVATLPTKISGQVFASYIKGKCLVEKDSFRSALISYFAKSMPSKTNTDHMTSADLVISTTQDDAANAYNDLNR